MDPSRLTVLLIFHFLLWHQVKSSVPSLLMYHTSLINDSDNLLERFLRHFKTDYLEKRVSHHVVVVGASAEDLRQVKPLFESYPYVVCTKPETCPYRWQFGVGSFVIIFLHDLREETLHKNAKILLRCKKCKVLYIFEGIIQNSRDINSLFVLTAQKYGVSSRFAHLDKNVTKLYDSFMGNNCTIEIGSTDVWTPGSELDTWPSGLGDLNGCVVTLSTLDFAPKMETEELKNGSIKIIGGVEGQLVLALAKKLNFTLEARYPSMLNRKKYSRKSAIVHDVDTGNTQIGIGRLRPTSNMYGNITYSIAYDHECVTWAVPRVMIWADNILWLEFTWQVWVLAGLVFTIICMIGSAAHNIDSSITGKQKHLGIVVVVIDILAIHLGIPVVNVPVSASGKFMLMIGLYYTLVLATAYKTSLASILTTYNGSPAIVDTEGIIEANLSVGGGTYNLDFLQDQVKDNETISKLINRFVVINDPAEVMRRLKFDGNFACLSRRSALAQEKYKVISSRQQTTFNIFKDCVLYHETSIVFRRESSLREPINHIIRRLSESGILGHWGSLVFDPEQMMQHKSGFMKYFESRTREKFKYVFFFYFSCVAFCFVVFFVEIGMSMLDSRRRKNQLNRARVIKL